MAKKGAALEANESLSSWSHIAVEAVPVHAGVLRRVGQLCEYTVVVWGDTRRLVDRKEKALSQRRKAVEGRARKAVPQREEAVEGSVSVPPIRALPRRPGRETADRESRPTVAGPEAVSCCSASPSRTCSARWWTVLSAEWARIASDCSATR